MSDFEAEFSNQDRSNIASFFDVTPRSTFSGAQRSKIADIVAAVVRAIQMQQSTSSFISETHFMTQESTFTEFIKK
jgi:hypothetical protein